MNILELIESLQEIAQDYPDAEVRMAVQPTYPMAEILRGVVGPESALDAAEDMDEAAMEIFERRTPIQVWLVSGGQDFDEPYAPGWVFQNCP